jgi:hypothetical protein
MIGKSEFLQIWMKERRWGTAYVAVLLIHLLKRRVMESNADKRAARPSGYVRKS